MTTTKPTPTTEQQEEARRIFESAMKEPTHMATHVHALINAIATALATRDAAARVEEREECAKVAENPYGDEVQAMARDGPLTVSAKVAAAIRARSNSSGEEGR